MHLLDYQGYLLNKDINVNFALNYTKAPEGAEKLYWKGSANYIDGALHIKQGEAVDFCTYFNLLKVNEIYNLTGIDSWSLTIDCDSNIKINIYKFNSSVNKTLLIENYANEVIAISNDDEYLGVELKAIQDCRVKDIQWIPQTKILKQEINPVIIICTHNRHSYLKKTLNELEQGLPEGWSVLVIDNESEPPVNTPIDNRFTVIRNPNTGGAGGFTRGLIESLKSNYTHALLMDDDIILDAVSVHRTDFLLRNLKDEYRSHFISGGMLRTDNPVVQYESSAYWDGCQVVHLGHNMPLDSVSGVGEAITCKATYKLYAAWWFCCIPLHEKLLNNLPIPGFIMGDDIDYSLQHASGIIRMNGISVWHEVFVAKQNPVKLFYLSTRNGLLVNIRNGYGRWKSFYMFAKRFFSQWLKGKKYEASLVCQGAYDVLKGPNAFISAGNPFVADFGKKYSILDWCKIAFSLMFRYSSIKKLYKDNFDKKFWDRLFLDF